MIRNPNDIQDGAKKIRMLIAGYPGIGKSTLALSAPRPLHIDCDFGIDRIEPRYRMPYIQPRSYDEILNDLKPENLKDFETLVFDTAGKLITLMGLWAIKQNPKYGQRDGSLSLKGYGFVGREFVRLMDYCFYELKKNIVVVFHATEKRTAITPVSASRLRARPRTMCGAYGSGRLRGDVRQRPHHWLLQLREVFRQRHPWHPRHLQDSGPHSRQPERLP